MSYSRHDRKQQKYVIKGVAKTMEKEKKVWNENNFRNEISRKLRDIELIIFDFFMSVLFQ